VQGGLRRILFSRGALLVTSVLTVFVACEALLRSIDFNPTYWEWHGTRLKLDSRTLYRLVGRSRGDLNADGYRDYSFDVDKEGRTRVLVSGDSFVFGDNVSAHETFPKVMERQLGDGYQVFNMGIAGDGPDQSYARLLVDGLRFDPDAVILALHPANDFADLAKNRLYVLGADGRAVYNPDNPVAAATPSYRTGALLRKALTGRGFSAETEEHLNSVFGLDPPVLLLEPQKPAAAHRIRLMRAVLRRFRDELAERDILYRVVIIPSLESIQDDSRYREYKIPADRYFANDDIASQICEEEGIEVLDLRQAFLANRDKTLYMAGDGHLSVRGNLLVGRLLARDMESSRSD